MSVFADNAGVVRFDDELDVCFKVETHNHPSAIDPYGGANTGLGGVIRDALGTGLGAKPICNTDVFCVAPPDLPPRDLPAGVLHPKRVLKGVVAGVRDYGNRMGIPTVNGALAVDAGYLANPLVFCGTVGVLPRGKAFKKVHAGDRIVAIGGRTGRDGIHGATFSSRELTAHSDALSGGAVQIGNAITEKMVEGVILAARDQELFHAITDCGAGGFSSAVGEMGADKGALVELERAPLKYQGLSYTEIWISEAQERMVLAVPPDKWPALLDLCRREDVEATDLGEFTNTGRLVLRYHGQLVADLSMNFLHNGRPAVVRQAWWAPPAGPPLVLPDHRDLRADLIALLQHGDVCSKEWIVRQYDHEVQGRTVIKPLVGTQDDGPGDAAVVLPAIGSTRGLAVACGINPRYGQLDPYAMAACVIDEAIRNCVAVGADPSHVALLDNFCWGNTERPETLGSLVLAAQACHDIALAYRDSLHLGQGQPEQRIHPRGTEPGHPPYSAHQRDCAGPRCAVVRHDGPQGSGQRAHDPGPDPPRAGRLALGSPGRRGGRPRAACRSRPGKQDLRRAAPGHPAPARAKLPRPERGRACRGSRRDGTRGRPGCECFARAAPHEAGAASDLVLLFSESPSRFLLEVRPECVGGLTGLLEGLPMGRLGFTTPAGENEDTTAPRLIVRGLRGSIVLDCALADLKTAWQRPFHDL